MRSSGSSSVNPYEQLADLADSSPQGGSGYGVPSDPERDGHGEHDPGQTGPDPEGRRARRPFGWFTGVRVAVKAVVALVTLAVILTLADRWSVLYAEHKAQEQLKKSMKLNAAPEVEIHGFPFLTQVLGKRLGRVDVTVPDVAADRVTIASVHARAYDIDVLTNNDSGVPTALNGAVIDRVRGDVLLSFDDLDRELGSSQVSFRRDGPDRVRVDGGMPIAGHQLKVHAQGTIRRTGARGVAVEVGDMRVGVSGLATFRPGQGPGDGLRLTRQAADRVSRDGQQAKAMLGVGSLASRLGVAPATVARAQENDTALRRITGRSDFVPQVMRTNLVDLASDNPDVLRRLGIDPDLADSVSKLTKPDLSSRMSLRFRMPESVPGSLRIDDVRVEDDGIRAELSGRDLAFGNDR